MLLFFQKKFVNITYVINVYKEFSLYLHDKLK